MAQRLGSIACVLATAVAGCSRSAPARVQNGDKFMADQKVAEAVIEYQGAVNQDGRDGIARQKLGRALLKTGNIERALGHLIRAADLLPQDVQAQIDAAKALLATGRFEDAHARAEAAMKLDPKNVSAHLLRASATANQRDLEG